MSEDRRMQGYYIGFDATGVPEIDKILGAIACAGKAVHHTNEWGDEMSPMDDHTGASPNDWIQNAANEAAEKFNKKTKWAQDDAAKIEKLQPFATAVVAATKAYTQ